jgi:hypothetical protein
MFRRFEVLVPGSTVARHDIEVFDWGGYFTFVAILMIPGERVRASGWFSSDGTWQVVSELHQPDCDEPWWWGYDSEEDFLRWLYTMVRFS